MFANQTDNYIFFDKLFNSLSKLSRIWNPDILMYNSASKEFDSTYKVNIIVYSDGSCKYGPPGIFTSTCQVIVDFEKILLSDII